MQLCIGSGNADTPLPVISNVLKAMLLIMGACMATSSMQSHFADNQAIVHGYLFIYFLNF